MTAGTVLAGAAAAALALAEALLPGTYTNEEQVAFAAEAGRPAPPWAGLEIRPDGAGFRLRSVDPYGAHGAEDQRMTLAEADGRLAITTGRCTRLYEAQGDTLRAVLSRGVCRSPYAFDRFTPEAMYLKAADGTGAEIELRRARAFRCWAAVPKRAPRPDGAVDWWGARNLVLHDQGGRVAIATDEAEPQRFELRMRRVVFPTGPNQPSLVLYVHRPGEPRALAYSWADPGAVRVGINIRQVQASCTLDQKEATSAGAR